MTAKTCRIRSATILAGGQSSRMGRNKAVLRVGGTRMIERVVEAARAIATEVLLIANEAPDYRFLNLPTFPDIIPNCGPLGGIYTALTHARHDPVLVLACDLPFISKSLLQQLCEHYDGAVALAVSSAQGIEPLCAIYSKRALPVVAAQLDSGDYKMMTLLRELDAASYNIAEMRDIKTASLANVNTPEELAQARQMAGKIRNHHHKKSE